MSISDTEFDEDAPLVVSPRRARRMLDCGNTRLYELLKNKELESYLDGRSRKITVNSIRRYIARRLIADGATTTAPLVEAQPRGCRPHKKSGTLPSAP